MDYGIVDLGSAVFMTVQCKNTSRVATAPDATPAYKIYGPAMTLITSGSFNATIIDSNTGYYGTTVTCSSGAGFAVGTAYRVRVTYAISSTTYVEEHGYLVT
mgnify:CR=1 FL=1